MRPSLIPALLATTLQTTFAFATEPQAGKPADAQQITLVGEQPSAAGPARFFTGRVRVDPVWPTNENINASGGLVTFEPGA